MTAAIVNHEQFLREAAASTFCLSPGRGGRWAVRTFQMIVLGCPVVFFDDAHGAPRPFADWIDYRAVSVTVAHGAINTTRAVLQREAHRACDMERALSDVAPLLSWTAQPVAVLELLLVETLAKVSARTGAPHAG